MYADTDFWTFGLVNGWFMKIYGVSITYMFSLEVMIY